MEPRLSIGILCHPTYGGSGVIASELALSLAGRGHAVHLFSHRVPPRLARSPGPVTMHRSQGLPYPLFSSTPHDLATTSNILRVHRSEGLDLLHAHYALPHAVSAVLAQSAAGADPSLKPLAVITTLHGTDITIVGSDPSYAPLTQYLLEASDVATAVSNSLAAQTRDHFCLAANRGCDIEVVPNFVDTDRFRPHAGDPSEGASSIHPQPHAVHVSNFRAVKRVPWLIEAFGRATEGTDATLTLVGDGPDQQHAIQRARELGLERRVCFLGERDALPELLAPADVFLLTSREESFGLSALEAMSCGTPVVATAVGGVPEVVLDGETGLLAPPDDQVAYAAKLKGLLFDRPRARSMGHAARKSVLDRFSRDRIVSQYEALYRRVLARREQANTCEKGG
jgi:N-acetyl-alpha-D-glucosaminyl L-malate synthase BshA